MNISFPVQGEQPNHSFTYLVQYCEINVFHAAISFLDFMVQLNWKILISMKVSGKNVILKFRSHNIAVF